MSALSCMTLTDTELLSLSSRQTYNDAIIPSINTPVNPINIYTIIPLRTFLSQQRPFMLIFPSMKILR